MEQNLSLYKIFNTVAQTKNISKAAKVLFISQPAISKAISKLEKELDTTLFIRTSRGVSLTNEGTILYQHTNAAFETLTIGEETLRKMNDLGMGEVHIGVTATLCKYILVPLLQDFVQEYPHIKVIIDCQATSTTVQQLEKGQIDIGLLIGSSTLKNLKLYQVDQIEDILVATKTYIDNLKARHEGDDFNLFAEANIMLLDKKNVTRQHIDSFFADQGININPDLEVTNMDLLIDLAKIGIGISGVVKDFVQKELENGELIEIPLDGHIPKRAVCFAIENGNSFSKSAQIFLEFVREKYGL